MNDREVAVKSRRDSFTLQSKNEIFFLAPPK